MSLYFGKNKMSAAYYGSAPVQKIYYGKELVYANEVTLRINFLDFAWKFLDKIILTDSLGRAEYTQKDLKRHGWRYLSHATKYGETVTIEPVWNDASYNFQCPESVTLNKNTTISILNDVPVVQCCTSDIGLFWSCKDIDIPEFGTADEFQCYAEFSGSDDFGTLTGRIYAKSGEGTFDMIVNFEDDVGPGTGEATAILSIPGLDDYSFIDANDETVFGATAEGIMGLGSATILDYSYNGLEAAKLSLLAYGFDWEREEGSSTMAITYDGYVYYLDNGAICDIYTINENDETVSVTDDKYLELITKLKLDQFYKVTKIEKS